MSDELRVLVTGFVPFRGDPYNPSGVTARALDGLALALPGGRARIFGRGEIPVRFADEPGSAADAVLAAIHEVRPDVVVSLGQGSDLQFRVELRARENPEHRGGPAPRELRARIDADRALAAMRAAGCDAVLSEDAGLYVCEDLFHHLLRWVDAQVIRAAAFLHVPRYVRIGEAVPNAPRAPGQTAVPQSLIDGGARAGIEALVAAWVAEMDG